MLRHIHTTDGVLILTATRPRALQPSLCCGLLLQCQSPWTCEVQRLEACTGKHEQVNIICFQRTGSYEVPCRGLPSQHLGTELALCTPLTNTTATVHMMHRYATSRS